MACVWAEWGRKGTHQGATAKVQCSEDSPVLLSCVPRTGVLKVDFTVHVVMPDDTHTVLLSAMQPRCRWCGRIGALHNNPQLLLTVL